MKAFKYTEKDRLYVWTNYGLMEITLEDYPYFGDSGKPIEIEVPEYFKEEEVREFLQMIKDDKIKVIGYVGCDGIHRLYTYKNKVVELLRSRDSLLVIHNTRNLCWVLRKNSCESNIEKEISKLKAFIAQAKKGVKK